jgi:hypothetical protein
MPKVGPRTNAPPLAPAHGSASTSGAHALPPAAAAAHGAEPPLDAAGLDMDLPALMQQYQSARNKANMTFGTGEGGCTCARCMRRNGPTREDVP